MTKSINVLALESRLADTASELGKLTSRVVVLSKKRDFVRADERKLAAAVEALVVAEAELKEEQATNPGTPKTKFALVMAQNACAIARTDVLEAEEQLHLERFGFRLKWNPATEAELTLAERRLPVLETRLVQLTAELEATIQAEALEAQKKAERQARLNAKRDQALAILRADAAREKARLIKEQADIAERQRQLEALGVDDPVFAKLAKAPVKKPAPEPTPAPVVVTPELKLEEVPVTEPVAVVKEVVVTPPPAAPVVEEEPEHPVLAMFKNWQQRHGHAVTRNRPVARAIDQAYAAK